MKIAIPIYGDNVSNVFDFAHQLLLVDIENGKEANRSEVALESQSLPQRAGQLKNLGASVLVCGAISQALANMVTASGIQVLPYVTGSVDDVLQAYLNGQLVQPQFSMPGCWPGARRGFGRGGRGHRWRGGRGQQQF
jgi:predicted Fe-Mo cluster-binding NifX family protein